MSKKALFTVCATVAWLLTSCNFGSTASGQTDTESLTANVNKDGVGVSLTADWPTADTSLQTALATYMRNSMPSAVSDTAYSDGQALLAACAEAAWGYMQNPLIEGDEDGIDIILGEGDMDEDSEIPTAEELAAYDGNTPRSTYTADFSKVYDTIDYITWQCSWNLYAEGTPHPAYGLTGITYRKADGLSLGHDILKDTDSKGFQQLLKESLRQWLAKEWEWKDATDQEMAEALQEGITLDALPLPANAPFLLPEGVALPYQEYELTGGRDIQLLILPYNKVKPYLKN